jgi:hypothetical protein
MAKNKNKNKNNNNKQQPQVKPIPTVVMKAVEELTSEEREELKAKGEAEKTQLIQEGQAEKERLIGEGEAEKKKIIDRAAKEAQKSVDEIQRQYIDEVREEAVEEANAEKEKIIAEATAIKDDVAAKQEEVDAKLTEIEKQYEDLASKMEQVTKDSAELETKKKAYKVDALQEVSDQIKEFNSTINTLEEEKIQLEKKLKQKEQELASCNEDKDCYLEKLNESGVRKQELMKLEYEIESLKKRNETLEELYNKCKEEKDKYYNQVEKFGQNPSDLIDECNRLEEQNKTLQNRLANVPTNDEIARLRKIDEEFEKTIAELLKLKTEKIETDRKLADLDIYSNDLDNSRRFIRLLEAQRAELQRELDRIQENYNNRQDNVFASLTAIDSEPITANYPRTGRTLVQICDGFRNYLAARKDNPLYYSKESIRTFFAGLAASRIIILQGMSGTGKSSLPKSFKDYMLSVTDRIEVQSSWKDRNDLLGFYNDFEKRYKETKFLEALYRATRDRNNIHLIMLDEMNLSRIEYYFADFLSVLEEEKSEDWKISLVSRDVRGILPQYIQDGELPIGENTWFIGTANKDDSTFTITDKVYDRAIVLNFDERAEEFKASYNSPIGVSYAELNALLKEAVQLPDRMKDQIKTIVNWLDESMQTYFEISFGNRISKQINMFVPAYVKCGGEVEEAIDIIFASKVLRKLQGLYDESTKNGLNEFLKELKNDKNTFGTKLKLTKATIQKMIDRI